jgi:tyramine---L-glutamate ligase
MIRMSSIPRVLVYEFISAGGWLGKPLYPGLVFEGLAMLWSALADFRRSEKFHTATALDARFEAFLPGLDRHTLPCDQVTILGGPTPADVFSQLLGECDAALIIAPETGGELARLSRTALAAGIQLLGALPEGIEVAGDKAECARRFARAGLPVPRTQVVTLSDAREAGSGFGFPLVVKPSNGVGCEGVSLAQTPAELDAALNMIASHSSGGSILLQSYQSGIHSSLSMIAAGGEIASLSLNGQIVEPGLPFTYRGGSLPLHLPMEERAWEVAHEALKLIPGLHGYLGMDFVITDQEAWLIEINPRLTTPYIGLRQVLEQNLAELIWDACTGGNLPETVTLTGQVEFRPDQPATWFNRATGMPGNARNPLNKAEEGV